ncbi:MAG: hypothetical protein GXO26_07880 [Crenarchaeota archaeon]|nr:hypothetical protein [Thermoproteota archaeon]
MSWLRLARTRYGSILPLLMIVTLSMISLINVAYAATGTTTSGSKSTYEFPSIFVNIARFLLGMVGLGLLIDGFRKLGEGRGLELFGGLGAIGLAIALPYLLQMFGVKLI